MRSVAQKCADANRRSYGRAADPQAGRSGEARRARRPDSVLKLAFRALSRNDYPEIIKWRQAPHAAEWFPPSPGDLRSAEAKYGSCVDGTSPTKVHVVELDGRAIGYIQHYLVRDYPAYLAAVNDAGAAAVD